MKIEIMSLGPLGTNCYIVYQDNQALVFDPGGEPEKVKTFLSANQLDPKAILLTHGHFDHIGAVDTLRKFYEIDVYIHQAEADWLEDAQKNGSLMFIGETIQTQKPDQLLAPEKMTLGNFQFEIIHTPGHSPGSVTFLFHEQLMMISGDVLFYQGIGRTDLPGGNFEELKQSIKQKIYTLDKDFDIYPGHGPKTSIANEKKANPFIPC
ncbi:MBL fold metallo-hydrolase [Virgibacillus salexigens]|uniref:Putative polyketide biosynthesis zinc-dependent hydrolase PksB n=1 Tax=Virgibacillus massiliensis TaxID=1462526 RepID=A0A024QBT3_9BACI|nr:MULTISPECIES: MBL fold metallo-hydrolase [Virgibacillus]MYL41777.1 MBL fold metallo-hydrolase [Virgibacillus massiliensis]CDQ39665.1 putative polyketide biosynthesis zinc-dependent hydrolase PksB [Virgibacillus massiliensis]